ncbi:uncharacterized protein [Choristoneura fumiferana]|uniref:uncharacterized protein n=1 Tax=Choristoneura fumiferana TaxID=7141 RepID=UPI003D15B61E
MFIALPFCLMILSIALRVQSFCGASVRWSHYLNIEDAYGVWYGVGYAQHTPDMTNKPIRLGCITLYVTDATAGLRDDWKDWSIRRRLHNDSSWRSHKSNPWSGNSLSGSWRDVRFKRRKRDMYQERRLRVLWDEDGQTMEQTYVYSPDEPGLWTAEQWRPGEREMRSRGVDMWYPDDPPRHPEVIRVLKLTPDKMIINHCTELGDGGSFSLILRRSPVRVDRWEKNEWQKLLLSYGLTNPYRYIAVCAACVQLSSLVNLFVMLLLMFLLSL